MMDISAASTILTGQALTFAFPFATRCSIRACRPGTRILAIAHDSSSPPHGPKQHFPPQEQHSTGMPNPYQHAVDQPILKKSSERNFKDYVEKSNELIRMADGGPPRWFSPLECGARLDLSPLLLYLPGMIGLGTGLSLHHDTLGKIFDIWCLHIPFTDKTSFKGIVKIVESTVRSEFKQSPKRPIYLVGESLGACIALAVAARNPEIDLILILANPATSFDLSPLKHLINLCVEAIPDQLSVGFTRVMKLVTGDQLKRFEIVDRLHPFLQILSSGLREDLVSLSSYLPVLARNFTKEALLWKFDILNSASAYANARLQSIRARTLVIASGRDQLLPSEEEATRMRKIMPRCEIRIFAGSGHQIFLEKEIDLSTIIKGASFYQRGESHDFVSDFIPPTPAEFKKIYNISKFLLTSTSPVLLSKLQDGRVVRGMAGVPREGPVLFVGYHMLFGFDVLAMLPQVLYEENILIRGLAHPLMFNRIKDDGLLPPVASFDMLRLLGVVPVNKTNFYNLMASKSHALLYPGGIREACHRKGEEYVLHWPEAAEFVRMAARFGATIVPFGTVGEDDLFEVVLDYEDQMKIPIIRELAKSITGETVSLSRGAGGQRGEEVAKQEMHYPLSNLKPPGRFYYLFGKPIETKGRENDLRDKDRAGKVYLQAKEEVQDCIAFLKEKRERDPYRTLAARLTYRAIHGPHARIPTFDL